MTRTRKKSPLLRAEQTYEKLCLKLITELRLIHKQGIKGKGLAWSNQQARYLVARRVYRFAYGPLKQSYRHDKHSRLRGLVQYCEQELEFKSVNRLARSNPFLLGVNALEFYFDDWFSNNKSLRKRKSKQFKFLEKHLLLKNQTKSNIGNILLLFFALDIPSKKLKKIFESGQVTTIYNYLNSSQDKRPDCLPIILDDLVSNYIEANSPKQRKHSLDDALGLVRFHLQNIFPVEGQIRPGLILV